MKKILIVGSQHGNELLGEQLYAFIKKQPAAAHIEVYFLLANPKARRQNVRFVESDMNRSFGGADTYEAQRAVKVLQTIKAGGFDLVIDAHTTTTSQPPCLIVHGIVEANRAFVRATHVQNVVVMKHEFVARSLIGHVPHAISLEVSNDDLSEALFAKLYNDLLKFARGGIKPATKTVFVVSKLLRQGDLSAQERKALQNFQRSARGFYPVLAGEKAYAKHTDYIGFIAQTKEEIIV